METLEERVAHLEGRAMEQTVMMANLSRDIGELRHEMNVRFASIDARFVGVDGRFLGIEGRLAAIDQKISTQFLWLVGLMVSGGLALFTAILNR